MSSALGLVFVLAINGNISFFVVLSLYFISTQLYVTLQHLYESNQGDILKKNQEQLERIYFKKI